MAMLHPCTVLCRWTYSDTCWWSDYATITTGHINPIILPTWAWHCTNRMNSKTQARTLNAHSHTHISTYTSIIVRCSTSFDPWIYSILMHCIKFDLTEAQYRLFSVHIFVSIVRVFFLFLFRFIFTQSFLLLWMNQTSGLWNSIKEEEKWCKCVCIHLSMRKKFDEVIRQFMQTIQPGNKNFNLECFGLIRSIMQNKTNLWFI